MPTFPNSPCLHKRGMVLRYAESSAVQRVIMPNMLTRTLQSGVVPRGSDK
jgi:hypothetical protein